MVDPLGFDEKITFLPSAFESVARLEAHSSFDQWLAALAESGFSVDFQRASSGDAWPRDLDPMAPAPAPKSISSARRHALASHPGGFVALLASGPGVVGFDGAADESRRSLASLHIHHQTDLGASISDMRRGAFGSGGSQSLGDGTRVFCGSERMRADPGQLAYFLAECHHEARPVPLALWGHSTILVEHELFSSVPKEAAFGGPDHAEARERFAERLSRDWADFVGALPPEVASRVGATGVCRGPGGPKRPEFRYAACVHDYWAGLIAATGTNWPSERDSSIMASWSSSINQARFELAGAGRVGVHGGGAVAFAPLPLEFDQAGERPLGANPLHLVASFHTHPVDAQNAFAVARAWLASQSDQDLAIWLGQRDARGLTPAGVAFDVWMRDGSHDRCDRFDSDNTQTPRVIDLFLELGWVGADGEFAQVAHDTLCPPPARWSKSSVPATLGHAIALDRVDRAALAAGREWLAPLRCASGVASTRAEALAALIAKFGHAQHETRAYLEALALRCEIATSPPPLSSIARRPAL